MDLFAPLQKALAELQYEQPTPVQAKAIPPAIEGRDILGCAQTGTGKTAAFALPILDYLGHERPRLTPHRPTALILSPTRELAVQIGESFKAYGKHIRFRQALVYGGVSQRPQVNALRKGVDVLIATPGRLQDLMEQKQIHLGNVQMFVLDEADRMMDMGFLPEIKKIIAKLPRNRQSMFFSATLPKKSKELSQKLLTNPVSITVAPKKKDVSKIDQKIRLIEKREKFLNLCEILSHDSVDRTIVFTRTKRAANIVTSRLEKKGVSAAAIHGNKTQRARQNALDSFRDRKVKVLVATDVASRGIDIQGVTHVVNFDMPDDPEAYVHRIGRTGRAGADGVAISFCSPGERGELRAIERLIGRRLNVERAGAIEPCENQTTESDSDPHSEPREGNQPRRRNDKGRRPNHGRNRKNARSKGPKNANQRGPRSSNRSEKAGSKPSGPKSGSKSRRPKRKKQRTTAKRAHQPS